ncbi:SNARE domain [Carpediemonas membranifera]|uniref:SNARE domain n=1 Tax=Carpediemonas membranifera TaxID=201153 RepID=A0A8J6BAD7_9EUKA|nr:SNARE domain [Carpediemonas membranifera]|eukprot:KAG9397459.1 SNARE domain [Carpediemonas membranifera]
MNRFADLRSATADVEQIDVEVGLPDILDEEDADVYGDDFSKLADTAKKTLGRIEKHIENIVKAQKRDSSSIRISDVLAGSSESQIQRETMECRNKIDLVTKTLKQMDLMIKNYDGPETDVELRSRKNVYDYTSREMVRVVTQFQQMQAANREAFRQQLKRQIQIADMSIPEDRVEMVVDGVMSGDPDFDQAMQQEFGNSSEVVNAYREAKERHADIVKLTQSIKELHDMHKQFLFLVAQQSETLNHVADNISVAKDHVEKGVKQLAKAAKHQKKGRKIIYIIICVLLVILVLAIVVLALGLPLTLFSTVGAG